MSKSLIYTVNSTSTPTTIGKPIPMGGIVRRYGRCLNASGSSITIGESGYYNIDVSATFTGDVGNAILQVMHDGNPIEGATVTETIGTATTEYHSVTIPSVDRVYCCAGAIITVVVDSASTSTPTTTNLAVRVAKD